MPNAGPRFSTDRPLMQHTRLDAWVHC